MATTLKKRGELTTFMGRPCKGCLSTYENTLVERIRNYRINNEGWGTTSILVELQVADGYDWTVLPSRASVARYLKEQGFIKEQAPKGILPSCIVPKVQAPHDLWEMDAQGAIKVSKIGYQSIINIKDSRSRKYCMSFPVDVKNQSSQPSTIHYKWALRLAFMESGLPKVIQVDKDSVFIENSSKSPYPSRLQLWLIALGVELSFIKLPPPLKQAMVERSHQTIEKQAIKGKKFETWQYLFEHITLRRKRLNEVFPSKSLNGKAPLEQFPQAKHSGKTYQIEQEHQLICLNRVYDFLEKGQWYRKVSTNKIICIGQQRYYLKKAIAGKQLLITFSKNEKQFIFRNVNEQVIAQLPIKDISKRELVQFAKKQLIDIEQKLKSDTDFPLKTYQ